MHTKAAVIAAEALVRDGIKSMLSIDRTVSVVGESAHFADISQVRRRVDPDLFIIDASGLGPGGEVRTRWIRSLVDMADRPLVLLADDGVQPDMELLRLGACVLKRSRMSSADLVSSVRMLAIGYLPVERGLAQQLANRALEERAGEAPHVRLLTPREREVFHLLARGKSNMEIAASLTLANSTVKTHVQGILKKLGLTSRVEVVMLAHRQGRRPAPSAVLRQRVRGRTAA
ncbi:MULTISPECIES: LuxR C-terminal-related transcriptional regulator [Streptomyces]|uniref:LuxR C-terminal-related transcriptional regulator n=1 Tax=Streptomyces TaxID=1883 RepID=UPI0004CC04AE|nr:MULTISPECIES: response regulator transcription factor [Streptomyces]ONI51137.1 Transcriptional regulatory protein LiaR [Streptomyces sp. IB2014 011-1]CAD5967919.1 DNA-binding response regulator [Streptomyces sp. KY70]CAD5976048.1 DNA-binding response regulator [Streptomyces sp. KY75]